MIDHRLDFVTHDESIGDLLHRVVADAEQVARAEIAVQKARLSAKVSEGSSAAIYAVGALVAACMALTALTVGALLILQRLLGPGWATLIVVGTLSAVTALLGWLALGRFKLMFGAAK